MNLTDEQLYLAAMCATPRRDNDSDTTWEFRVARAMQKIKIASGGEKSPITQALAELDEQAVTPFVATITFVRAEKSSRRTIVELYTGTEEPHKDEHGNNMPAGFEMIRTPPRWKDQFEGYVCQELTANAIDLIGHRVLVFKRQESFTKKASGQRLRSRVLVELKDLGVDERFEVETKTQASGRTRPYKAHLVQE